MLSKELISFVAGQEGFRYDAYEDGFDSDGNQLYSVGYGQQTTDGGQSVSRAEGDRQLVEELTRRQTFVDNHVKVALEPHQRDALTSLTYNIGTGAFADSTLLRQLNKGNYEKAAKEFERWVYSTNADGDKIKLPALVSRREQEAAMFRGDSVELPTYSLTEQDTALRKNTMRETIQNSAGNIWNETKRIATELVEDPVGTVKENWLKIGGALIGLFAVFKIFSSLFSGVGNFFGGLFNTAAEEVGNKVETTVVDGVRKTADVLLGTDTEEVTPPLQTPNVANRNVSQAGF